MNEVDTPNLVYLVLLLMLVGSSLVAMRLPIGKAMKMAAAWVAIFGAGFVLFALRDDFSALGQRLKSEATGSPIASGQTLRIPIAEDGHFWVDAEVNGVAARFLVDSGASMTTVSNGVADAAGLERGYRVQVSTANGSVPMARSSAERFAVAGIERQDLTIFVTDRDSVNVIGMNFLSSLRRWGVDGRWLILEA